MRASILIVKLRYTIAIINLNENNNIDKIFNKNFLICNFISRRNCKDLCKQILSNKSLHVLSYKKI